MKLVRRQLMVLAGAAVCAPAVSSLASAQTYPSRPVRVIVPYAAGGPNDVVTRIITQKRFLIAGPFSRLHSSVIRKRLDPISR